MARELKGQIESGGLPAGSKLPSFSHLARESGLSVHEVRKVIGRLKQSGHITTWQGRGIYVAEDSFTYTLGRRTRFNVNMTSEGKNAGFNLVGRRCLSAPVEIARAFGLKVGTRVQRVELVRVVQGRPAMLARHYYPMSPRFAGILDLVVSNESVTKALRACGVADFTRRETSISTRLPNAHEALLLEIPRSQPVLVTIGVNVDANDKAVEVSEALSRGDRVKLRTQ